MKTTKLITIDDLKANFDTFMIDEMTRLKYSCDDIKDFNHNLWKMLDYQNKRKDLGLHLGLLGDNIDYTNIYYSL
jgi:CRISPR/Cas system-associated endonuclease Cas3-HD